MTSPAAAVLSALHPSAPVYAVLDGARDRTIRSWVRGTRAPAWSLYRGDVPDALDAVAPRLLRLGRGHEFTETFFQIGWRNAWGILFTSDADVTVLRRHLRKFLRARTEDGRILAFRYYDPRVLRLYLPTCTPEETKAFFGPIQAFAVEGEDPGRFHLFKPGPAGLEADEVRA